VELRPVGKVLGSGPLIICEWHMALLGPKSEDSVQLCHIKRSGERTGELCYRCYWGLGAGVVSYTPESGGEP
jgi:hypothetical protein